MAVGVDGAGHQGKTGPTLTGDIRGDICDGYYPRDAVVLHKDGEIAPEGVIGPREIGDDCAQDAVSFLSRAGSLIPPPAFGPPTPKRRTGPRTPSDGTGTTISACQ